MLLLTLPGYGNEEDPKKLSDSQTANNITPAEPVQINWMGHWKGESAREAIINAAKKEYEFLHPGVQINLTYNVDLPGEEKNYKLRVTDTIISMIDSGRIDWDIIYLATSIYEHVSEKLGNSTWARDNLVDFAKVPGFAETQKEFIITNPYYRDRLGGILTGPFIEGYIQNPWFNSELAEKVGIEIKERGMTFEDFLGYAKALHEYNKKNNTSIPFIKLCTWNRLELFFETFFKSQFDDFYSATENVFNDKKREAFLKTLLAFEELAQYQPILNSDWEQMKMTNYISGFLLNDDGLFITGGTYMHGHFYSIDPQKSVKLRPTETPILDKENGLMGDYSPTFAVMKNGPNRKTAVDFLLFLAQPKYAERWVSTTKSPTGLRGHLAKFAMEPTDIYEKFAMDMQQKYRMTPMVSLRTPTYVFGKNCPLSINELRLSLARILEGKLKAQEFYDDVMSRLEN